MKTLRIPRGVFNAVCYSPDGQFLLGLHSGWRLRVWATADLSERFVGRLPGTLYAHETLGLCGDLAVLTQGVYDLRDLWAALRQSGGPVRGNGLIREVSLEGRTFPFARVSHGTNGRVIVRTFHDWQSRSCQVSLWDANGRNLRTIVAPFSPHPLALSPDGRLLVFCGGQSAFLFDVAEERTVGRLDHTDLVRFAVYSPDGRQLAMASGRSLWLWDLESRKGERLPAFQKFVEGVAYHPEGKLLAAADRTGEIRLLEPSGRRQLASLGFGVGGLNGLAFSPDGMTVAGAGRDNAVVIWDVE